MNNKRIFVTGATGFIGTCLVLELVEKGHIVHALIRSEKKAEKITHEHIHFFKGDITDVMSIEKAMTGCDEVYHVAAFAQVWDKNPDTFYRLNVQATIQIFEIALRLHIKRIVYVSTAGVFGPSIKETITESIVRSIDYFTEYERTKAVSEEKALEFVKKGLEIIIVNPTRVYGPGELSKANSLTIMIKKYIEGKWHIIPGNGKSIGNYVFVGDVVNGMQLAMDKGIAGERYILGGENASYNQFFEKLKKVSEKNYILIKLPTFLLLFMAQVMMLPTRLFNIKPMITPAWAKRFLFNWNVSSGKANSLLGYTSTSLEEGMKKTIQWLEEEN